MLKPTLFLCGLLLSAGLAGAEDPEVMVVFQPRRKVVLSSEVASVVGVLHRELGQTISRGERLVTLADHVYQANLAQVQARLSTAKAQLFASQKLSRLDLEAAQIKRYQALSDGAVARLKVKTRLFRDNSLSTAELDAAKTEVAVAQADLELAQKTAKQTRIEAARELAVGRARVLTAQAAMRLAQRELQACVIAAPFSGRVSRVLVRAHEVVRAAHNLIEVVEDRTLLGEFLAPSRLVSKIALGQVVGIRVSETGSRVAGKVSHVGALIDPSSSTILVKVEVDNAGGALRGGMRGKLVLRELVAER